MAKPTRGGSKAAVRQVGRATTKSVLGQKGEPIDMMTALENVNKKNLETGDEGYVYNCQKCVWAYELQRRGYDVEAMPNYPESKDDMGIGERWIKEVVANKKPDDFIHIPRIIDAMKEYTLKDIADDIKDQMKEWGPGSRAIVRVYGHVFNVEQVGTATVVAEAQTGETMTVLSALEAGSRETRMSNLYVTEIMRTDDIVFKEKNLKNVVRRRT